MKSKVPGLFVVSVLAAGIVAGCGSSGGGEEEALKQQVHQLKGQVATIKGGEQEVLSKAEAAKVKTEDSRKAILQKAEGEAATIVGHAKSEAQKLANVEAEVSSQEQQLASVEESLHGAQQEKSLDSFGEGVMKAEVGFTPGATYEAPGGRGCYWALLKDANTNDTAGNEFTEDATQQIVTLDEPYFTSEGCGTWKQIE